MDVGCDDLVHARINLAPLECESLIGPLERDFVLTDVVFDLYDHPNGFRSRACGHVWNVMSGQWSRHLLGGHVNDEGRRYHFTTGILCPHNSRLSVCTCWFVSQPTSRLWAVLSGFYCERPGRELPPLDFSSLARIDWMDVRPDDTIDPIDPTGQASMTRDLEGTLVTRSLLGTVRDHIRGADLWVEGAQGRVAVAPGETTAVRLRANEIIWSSGDWEGQTRCPEGVTLAVVRRSLDGTSVQWICYAETHEAGPSAD